MAIFNSVFHDEIRAIIRDELTSFREELLKDMAPRLSFKVTPEVSPPQPSKKPQSNKPRNRKRKGKSTKPNQLTPPIHGGEIKAMREALGISGKEMAKLLGVNTMTIYGYEAKDRPINARESTWKAWDRLQRMKPEDIEKELNSNSVSKAPLKHSPKEATSASNTTEG